MTKEQVLTGTTVEMASEVLGEERDDSAMKDFFLDKVKMWLEDDRKDIADYLLANEVKAYEAAKKIRAFAETVI